MSRITKSKIYKPFIALLVAVILVFSFEVNKPKAIVPILIWGAGILAGVIAEEMLEMGIKHVTSDGKSTKKSKTGKIADEILDSLDGYDFDNTKPTRKADGSLEVNMSANDRAKIARKIADEFGDVVDEGLGRSDDYHKPFYNNIADSDDPLYDTSLSVYYWVYAQTQPYLEGTHMASEMYDLEYQPVAFEKKTQVTWRSVVTGEEEFVSVITGAGPDVKEVYVYPNRLTPTTLKMSYNGNPSSTSGYVTIANIDSESTVITSKYYDLYKKVLNEQATEIFSARGLVVPKTLKNVYSVGEGYFGDLPNKQELSNKPYKIPNYFPPSQSDDDVTWEIVQNHHDTDITNNQTKIDNEYETYLENGDLNNVTNTYNTQNINNYYTDTTYPVKNDDIKIDIDIDIVNQPPVVIDDDDGTGTVPNGESAPVIDRTLITYAKQTYDYLGDSIDGAITSMRDITDDASGLVNYLDTSFRWLPAEWRALFGSAFILGVFAHFMRR